MDFIDDDPDSTDADETCIIWSLRFFALIFFIAGSKGSQFYRDVDELVCTRAPAIAVFWEALRFLGVVWLVFDVTACCFFLRLSWLRRRTERFGRMFSCTAWVFCIFGLAQYSILLTVHQCISPVNVSVLVVLVIAAVIPLLWWALTDCDHICSNCGEAGHDSCCGACFELPEWPAAEEPADQALGDLELARPPTSPVGSSQTVRSPSRRKGSPKHSRAAGGSSAGSPGQASATKLGRSRLPPGPRRSAAAVAEGTIRVMRGGKVLHVGTTRRGVKRWIRRYLDNDRGVTIEDSTEMGMLPGNQAVRPASPDSSPPTPGSPPNGDEAGGSEPPSPALTPRGLGLEDSDDSMGPMFGRSTGS